jgi:hypothetical protein
MTAESSSHQCDCLGPPVEFPRGEAFGAELGARKNRDWTISQFSAAKLVSRALLLATDTDLPTAIPLIGKLPEAFAEIVDGDVRIRVDMELP